MQKVVGRNSTSHVLIVTHDPLMIGGLRRDQVQIFYQTPNKQIAVSPPQEDPIGMGIEGLLTSDLFGLTTTLDTITENDLERKQELTIKMMKGRLTRKEQQELQDLNTDLGKKGFLRAYEDPLYRQFVKAIQKDRPRKVVLTPEEITKQEKITLEIVKQLKRKHDIH
jgi:hypothetical protein